MSEPEHVSNITALSPTSTIAKLRVEDRKLLPIYVSTRPTYDEPGVLIEAMLDEGQRPIYTGQRIVGRLSVQQAEGIIHSLQLMVQIAKEEHP